MKIHSSNPFTAIYKPGSYHLSRFVEAALLVLLTLMIYSCASLKSSDYTKRIKALNRITDQNILYKVAMEDINPDVKTAAFNRIIDQNLINKLAVENDEVYIRLNAVKKVSDQNILYNVAMKDKNLEIRTAAFNRITDQNLINKLAAENDVADLRFNALKQVSDQSIIYKIALKDRSSKVREAAMKLLTPELLAKLATDFTDTELRMKVVELLNDQKELMDIALNNSYINIRTAAAIKVTDQDLVNRLAVESKDAGIRLNAVTKVTDQNILYKVALEDKSIPVMEAAMKGLKPELLTKLAADFTDTELKLKAVGMLNDQKELMNVSINNDNWTVRQAAFGKLDNNSLDNLIQEAKDPAVVLASKIRLGKISWNEAFSGATDSKGTLGNVIGAAALVESPQPTSADVVEACHNYIRRGDSSRIPELINLLNRFGDITLAEDYLNCGNGKLYDAGADWGNAHGYSISTGYGSHRVRWGEGK